MKRSPIKRKASKPRARGTGCQFGRRCLAVGEYTNPDTGKTYRVCAKHWADALFAEHIRSTQLCLAYGTKLVCNGAYQCCHVVSRRYMALRWSDHNAVCLCAAHHTYFTHAVLEWEQFCRDIGIDWDELRRRALNDPPMQPMFVIERLAA